MERQTVQNLKFMPKGKYYAIGYNSTHGLVDVCEENGAPFFEGRINIEDQLSKLQSEDQKEVDTKVEALIMEAYNNWGNYQNNPDKYTNQPTPTLEVLTYNGQSN